MLNIDGQSIGITRGDTGQFTITFSGQDAPEDGCTILVSLKKTKTSDDVIWEKRYTISGGVIIVTITSEDTVNLSFGQYWWDARILYRDGTIYTPMNPASFKVLEVIGNAG